ncbi:hypothetical protein [Flavobacterium sp.]|uniref:hypothetical protein n=1 Tax=Flavobacterium sp. TaxID=239 RepID=UPI002631097C|nr:hypothetical protein [Flavobacterium sp.]
MKLPKEFINGLVIFLGIGVYFLIMNSLGLSDITFLRLFNILFIIYGVNKTIVSNLTEGKREFLPDAISAFSTAFIGVVLSIAGLWIYSHMRGGDAFVETLSKTFFFGDNPPLSTYCVYLLFEGLGSCIIVTLILMFYHNNKYAID